MAIVEASIVIDGPRWSIFRLAQDYDLRLEWDPFLKEMRFLNEAQQAAVGVQVWVKAKSGLEMTVEYITLSEPKFVAMKMLKGPFFFAKFAGTWKFEVTADEQTRVTFRYSFTVKWLKGLADPIIRAVFQRDIRARLAGLKHAAENTDILARLSRA